MKKFLLGIIGLVALVAVAFLSLRQFSGWNDGMANARSEIHAAALDGNIYVVGGIGLFRVLDSCEKYAISTKNWSNCAALPRPLHHVAMAADQERVYASGGYVALPFEQDVEAALFGYDPQSDRWTEIAKLPNPIGQHAMVYRDGKLFLIGGQNGSTDLDSFWSYDLAAGEWHQMSAMPTARHSHAIAMSEGQLYVTGGRSTAHGSEIDKVEMYDFDQGKWTALSAMPTGRAGHGAFVDAGKLHVIGGESLTESKLLAGHDILNLTTGKWSKGPPMKRPRHGFAISDDPTLSDVYSIGGGAHPGIQTIYSVTGTTQKLPVE